MLQNFIANALRYTAIGGVLIAARRRDGAVEFSVWDTGPGIPYTAQTELIFEEFRRLDPPSPWGEKGLGLGLSICQRIAAMLGHPLALRSTPGRGSMFSIHAPITGAPVRLPTAAPSMREISGLDVLCIDDDPDILDGMRELLGRWGLTVRTASGLEPALQAVRERVPDLLLADHQLGEALDGLDALTILRRETGPRCSAALVTADRSESLQQRARDAGYPLLHKPIKPAALRALIAALARRRTEP